MVALGALGCAGVSPLPGAADGGGKPTAAKPGRAGNPTDEVITLDAYPSSKPQKFFEQIDALDVRPWQHAKAANIEVLSRCPDETTKRFVRELRARLQLMKAVRPEPPMASLDRPLRLFLFKQDGWWEMRQNPSAIPIVSGGQDATTLMVNLWSYDVSTDAAAKTAALGKAADEAARMFVIEQLIIARESGPASETANLLGLWSGLHGFYLHLRFAPGTVTLPWPPSLSDAGLKDAFDQTAPRKIALLPMAEIFDVPYPEQSAVWALQLDLFMRWALLADGQQHRAAFWKFARRGLTEPVTEKLFEECFGTTQAKVQAELAGYLEPGRAAREFSAIANSGINWPSFLTLEDATNEEIERFRTSVNFVIDHRPNL